LANLFFYYYYGFCYGESAASEENIKPLCAQNERHTEEKIRKRENEKRNKRAFVETRTSKNIVPVISWKVSFWSLKVSVDWKTQWIGSV